MARESEGQGGGVLSVAEFAAKARQHIESGLPLAWVAGEVSNFTRAASGHCYFSLKDSAAQLRCVMFRHRAQLLEWSLANGQQVEVRATPTLYEPRGDFQLNVDFARKAGLGALFEAFQRLKQRLQAEGLFDEASKRPLPAMPRGVGIVTSPQAAALRDVLTTLARRWPAGAVVLYPTPVQGDGAAARIAAAIEVASARSEVEVLIVCRGGGSIEDLWAFNDEAVARAIAGCAVPVVTGIGHETDFTIADFAADLRAPTPTAAAAAATPDRALLQRQVGALSETLSRAQRRSLERAMQQVDSIALRLRHPGERLSLQDARLRDSVGRLRRAWAVAAERRAWRVGDAGRRLGVVRPDLAVRASTLDAIATRLRAASQTGVDAGRARLLRLEESLRHLDPMAVLGRGYAIVRDAEGRVIQQPDEVQPGDAIRVRLSGGSLDATVDAVRPGD
jgi:exodeoxyribonuclease VII large subunit